MGASLRGESVAEAAVRAAAGEVSTGGLVAGGVAWFALAESAMEV